MDNMQDFLNVHAKLLERAHYRVYRATSVEKAEKILNEKRVHLAILDIRMEEENDPQDMSGLLLAQKAAYQSVPKIILTGHHDDPHVILNYVKTALGISENGVQPAVDFMVKLDGAEKLVETVDRVFARHVQINWELTIHWGERDPLPFSRLASLIDPRLDHVSLADRAAQMEDLFRKLFHENNHIHLERLLWQRGGRLAVLVHAFKLNMPPKSFVVVCGERSLIATETHRYKEFGPDVPSETTTSLDSGKETVHLSANRYGLAHADISHIQSLHELYLSDQEKIFRTALHSLFEKTLADWQQGKRIVEQQKSLTQIYREQLLLVQPQLHREMFQQRIEAILAQIPALNVSMKRRDSTFELQFGKQPFAYVDPTSMLFQVFASDRPVILTHTPGTLTGTNIVANTEGRAWVTDFLDAGLAPLHWNFAALESVIRFDWVEIGDLRRLHEMERCLIESRFSHLDINMVEPIVKKPLRAIQLIRQLASPTLDGDELPYHLAIFYHAASRIAGFDPNYPHPRAEFFRLAHLLITMSMLGERISGILPINKNPDQKSEELSIDKIQQEVWVRGKNAYVVRDGYKLLVYLYDHANQVCTRADIAKHVFNRKDYDDLSPHFKKLEDGLINAAILRLRKKIEDNPNMPRYIITRDGIGYCLRLPPED
jgi:DNA-binding response OmpR family regulator